MKRILFMLVLLAVLSAVGVTSTNDMKENIEAIALDTMTVDSQHTDYGDWERACSTKAIIEANDSGFVVITFSGWATIPQGAALYVGIDTLGSTVDTIWGMAKFEAPKSRTYSYITVPFQITKRLLIDSTTGTTSDTNMWGSGEYDTIPIVVGTLATSGSTVKISVRDLLLTTEFYYVGDN